MHLLAGESESGFVTLTVGAPAALSITTTTLPNGAEGQSYSTILAATGGVPPYRWSITSGSLPTGLSLNGSTGAISGTPSATRHSKLCGASCRLGRVRRRQRLLAWRSPFQRRSVSWPRTQIRQPSTWLAQVRAARPSLWSAISHPAASASPVVDSRPERRAAFQSLQVLGQLRYRDDDSDMTTAPSAHTTGQAVRVQAGLPLPASS